ncbi:HNH endonuclease [Pseudomonas alvandae]|jgi:HNH endonuclease.|uniref:HNH endonuclease n=1 Tax=Pseudomonas canavaninivorans TaxID=2842348 RepID=UPI002FF0B997
MSLFDMLEWSSGDRRNLFVKVRSCTGKWDTEKPEIEELRDRLLVLQKYRCAYCQFPIIADMVGYRELDHILPKDGNSNHTEAKKISDLEADRYSTRGYPQFRFEPKNLALICKPCNSSKSTYDSLINRASARPLSRYPSANRFSCFHPHFHHYAAHIEIDENFFYSHLTEEGRVLLKICGLMKVENLEKKFGPAALKISIPGRDLYAVVRSLTVQLEERNFGLGHAVNALTTNRKLSISEAQSLIAQSLNCATEQDTLLLKQTCQALGARKIASGRNRAKKLVAKALK